MFNEVDRLLEQAERTVLDQCRNNSNGTYSDIKQELMNCIDVYHEEGNTLGVELVKEAIGTLEWLIKDVKPFE